jgi:FixJ family two-component response regulator
MTNKPVVVIVDDEEMIRRYLERTLRSTDLEVSTFASPREILDRGLSDQPGCLILDLALPEMSGLELWRRLVASGCASPVILISGQADIPTAVRALRDGALDVLEKPLRAQYVIEAVRRAIVHDAQARNAQSETVVIQARYANLTAREKEVFRLVQQGMVTKQISRELDISPKTVDVHRSNIMKKMHVDSLSGLLHVMYRFIPEGPSAALAQPTSFLWRAG